MSAPWVVYGRGQGCWVSAADAPASPRGLKPAHMPPCRRREPSPYALAPLEAALGAGCAAEAARTLHVSTRTVQRLRRAGLTADQADYYAGRAGLHPLSVWEDWR